MNKIEKKNSNVLHHAHYGLENKIAVGVVLGLLITYKFYP